MASRWMATRQDAAVLSPEPPADFSNRASSENIPPKSSALIPRLAIILPRHCYMKGPNHSTKHPSPEAPREKNRNATP